eukprot:9109701-Ditylum_brightwellii.AAC.1
MGKLLGPEQINPRAQMMWKNKGDTSKNAQLTNAINDMQHGQPTKPKEEAPNKLTELSKSCEQTK